MVDKSEKTPGLQRRKRAQGRIVLYWCARTDIAKLGYEPRIVNLSQLNLDEAGVAAECQRLQNNMLLYADELRNGPVKYNGTIASLINWYQTDPISPYHRRRLATQRVYSNALAAIMASKGKLLVADVTGARVLTWFDKLEAKSSTGWAYLVISVFKVALSFGSSQRNTDCTQLRAELRDIKLKTPKPREFHLSHELAKAFCAKAIEMGMPSMALGMALQSELALRQKDVIGEWENGVWGKGLMGKHIDAQGVLRKRTTKNDAEAIHVIADYPDLAAILGPALERDRFGPLVVQERNRQPYLADTYRYRYRKIARAAGIPDEVWNMDARAGAISEGYEAGGSTKEMMAFATHSTEAISQRYNRVRLQQSRRAAQKRVQSRNGGS